MQEYNRQRDQAERWGTAAATNYPRERLELHTHTHTHTHTRAHTQISHIPKATENNETGLESFPSLPLKAQPRSSNPLRHTKDDAFQTAAVSAHLRQTH